MLDIIFVEGVAQDNGIWGAVRINHRKQSCQVYYGNSAGVSRADEATGQQGNTLN
jgi:hypothetical protein